MRIRILKIQRPGGQSSTRSLFYKWPEIERRSIVEPAEIERRGDEYDEKDDEHSTSFFHMLLSYTTVR